MLASPYPMVFWDGVSLIILDFSISLEHTAYILGEYGVMQDAAILF